jgi:hypothetical protein
MGGGTQAAITRMVTSSMTPGPLGMVETRPMASAPAATATLASSVLLMQQILILGRAIASTVTIVPQAPIWEVSPSACEGSLKQPLLRVLRQPHTVDTPACREIVSCL